MNGFSIVFIDVWSSSRGIRWRDWCLELADGKSVLALLFILLCQNITRSSLLRSGLGDPPSYRPSCRNQSAQRSPEFSIGLLWFDFQILRDACRGDGIYRRGLCNLQKEGNWSKAEDAYWPWCSYDNPDALKPDVIAWKSAFIQSRQISRRGERGRIQLTRDSARAFAADEGKQCGMGIIITALSFCHLG